MNAQLADSPPLSSLRPVAATRRSRLVSPEPEPFSLRLRTGTRRAHRLVERLAFVRGLLRGLLDPLSYQQLLADLHAVYGALEAGLRHGRAQPLLLPLVRPELFRQAALAADLDFLHGDTDWRKRPISTAGGAYVRRLEHIAEHDPSLLIGHIYTRYFGDLSGGPILGRMAALTLGLSGRQGLAFYDFPQIADYAAYKADLRRCLDGLPLSEAQAQAIISEAQLAFSYSGALFTALPSPT
ncbi:MAG TPA: biliverdin-producing heme oxygenase [Pseudomonadota bacterium]|nr:biliverdin-producing heme oxygenase [Pseudomonadota bacterium]